MTTNPQVTQDQFDAIVNFTAHADVIEQSATLCFSTFDNGANAGVGGTGDTGTVVKCGYDGTTEATALQCSGFSRQDDFGAACRAMCSYSNNPSNNAVCMEKGDAYCTANPGNADCACHNPTDSTSWAARGSGDSMTWGDLTTFMANNPDIAGYDQKCFWPPCTMTYTSSCIGSGKYSDPNVCPNLLVKCVVSDINVSLHNIQASHLNVVSQQCGSTTGPSSVKSNSTLTKGWDALPETVKIAGGIGLVLIVGVVIMAVVLTHLFKQRRLMLKEATAAATATATRARIKVRRSSQKQ